MTAVAAPSAGRTRPAARGATPIGHVVRFCVLAYLGLRVATLVAALVAHAFPSLVAQSVPGWIAPAVHPGWTEIFSAFERFDALWFLRIADAGYRVGDGSAAFFPLFPLATRALSIVLGGQLLAAATIVSNVAFVGALVAIFRLGEEAVGTNGARFGVLFLCAFPTAYFFVMPYSESVFLLCAATSILAARRERWALAGALGALAALTRSIGIVLAPALLFEVVQQRREGRRSSVALVAWIAPILGTATYATWWQARAGDWAIPLLRQQIWQRDVSWPWATLANAIRIAARQWGGPGGGYWVFDLLVVVPVLALAVVVAIRFRPVYGVYVWLSLLAPLTFVFAGRPLMSMPRFVATLFPIGWAVARLTERRRALRVVILAASGAAMLALCVLTVNWFYVF
jgi:hypothetical protein